MSINVDTSYIQQQLANAQQDEEHSEQELQNKEKMSKANGKLKKEMTKALFAVKHGHTLDDKPGQPSSKIPTGEAAIFLALEAQVQNNMADMAAHLNTLKNMNSEIAKEGSVYDQISKDQDDLASLATSGQTDNLNAKSAELKEELTNATAQSGMTSTNASTQTRYMTQDSMENAGLTGIGSFLINAVLDKQGNYSRG
jgi:hypothetical protein